jgi:hypothetical protein
MGMARRAETYDPHRHDGTRLTKAGLACDRCASSCVGSIPAKR